MNRCAGRIALAILVCSFAADAFAQVAVVRAPVPMLQVVGGPPDADFLLIVNAGNAPAMVTLTPSGGFFSLSATSVTLDPRSAQRINITPTATEAGLYNGSVTIAVLGAARSLSLPIRLYVGLQSFGTVRPAFGSSLIIADGLPGRPHAAQLNVSNTGTAIMTCLLGADVPWVDAPRDVLGVEPGVTKRFDFTTNPSLRPDGSAPLGAAVGTLAMRYLRGTSGDELGAMNSGTTTAVVVDITKASVVPQAAAPLAAGEVATFLAGLSDIGAVGHLFVSNGASTAVSSNQLFYSAAGNSSSLLSALGQLPAASSAWFPYSPQRLFDVTNQTGSVQLRTPQPSTVKLAGFVEVVPDGRNIYVTSVPVLSSNGSAAANETLVFAGVEKSANASTDLHLQEASGVTASYTIDFLDITGAVVGTARTGTLSPFQYAFFENIAPDGARAIRVRNASTNGSKIAGYAAVIDNATRDRWTITDSRRSGSGTEVVLPTIAGHDLNVWITNSGTSPASVTVSGAVQAAPSRRRAVRHGNNEGSRLSPSVESAITLAPGESRREVIPASAGGAVRVSGGSVSVSGNVRKTAAGRTGEFGTGVPALSPSIAVARQASKQFSLADDQPGIAPPSLLLLETEGRSVTVRVTTYFSFAAGTTATGSSSAFRDYEVAAGALLTVPDLLRSILGPNRDGLGRVFKIVIDVQPVSGDGKVIPYLLKNEASGDVSLYAD